MSITRQKAIESAIQYRAGDEPKLGCKEVPSYFGVNVFGDDQMKARLPKDIYASLRKTIEEGVPLALASHRRRNQPLPMRICLGFRCLF